MTTASELKGTFLAITLLAAWATKRGYSVEMETDLPRIMTIIDDENNKHEIFLPPIEVLKRGDSGFIAKNRRTGELLKTFSKEVIEGEFGGAASVHEIKATDGEDLKKKIKEALNIDSDSDDCDCDCAHCAAESEGVPVAKVIYGKANIANSLSDIIEVSMVNIGDKFFDSSLSLYMAIGGNEGLIQKQDLWNAIVLESTKEGEFAGQLRKFKGDEDVKIMLENRRGNKTTH